jgi:hypothetical protein
MRPLHHLLVPTVAALALLSSSAAADAPTRFFGHPKGGLHAPTDLRASAGCVDQDLFLFPIQNPDGTRAVFAEITRYDHCADQVVLDHFGDSETLTSNELSVASDLSSASLTATIPMYDGLDPSFPATDPLTLDLSWIASTGPYNENIVYANGHRDGITLVNHDHETCRDATVSGTAGDGVNDYAAGATAESQICRQIAGSLFLFIER